MNDVIVSILATAVIALALVTEAEVTDVPEIVLIVCSILAWVVVLLMSFFLIYGALSRRHKEEADEDDHGKADLQLDIDADLMDPDSPASPGSPASRGTAARHVTAKDMVDAATKKFEPSELGPPATSDSAATSAQHRSTERRSGRGDKKARPVSESSARAAAAAIDARKARPSQFAAATTKADAAGGRSDRPLPTVDERAAQEAAGAWHRYFWCETPRGPPVDGIL